MLNIDMALKKATEVLGARNPISVSPLYSVYYGIGLLKFTFFYFKFNVDILGGWLGNQIPQLSGFLHHNRLLKSKWISSI